MQIDWLDRKILEELQRDATLGVAVLAERVGSSPATCHRRVRALREHGLVKSIVAICSAEQSRDPVSAMIGISLKEQGSEMQAVARKFLFEQCEVRQAWLTTGDFDYMTVCTFEDLAHLNRFCVETLAEFAVIAHYRTFLALEEIKATFVRRF